MQTDIHIISFEVDEQRLPANGVTVEYAQLDMKVFMHANQFRRVKNRRWTWATSRPNIDRTFLVRVVEVYFKRLPAMARACRQVVFDLFRRVPPPLPGEPRRQELYINADFLANAARRDEQSEKTPLTISVKNFVTVSALNAGVPLASPSANSPAVTQRRTPANRPKL